MAKVSTKSLKFFKNEKQFAGQVTHNGNFYSFKIQNSKLVENSMHVYYNGKWNNETLIDKKVEKEVVSELVSFVNSYYNLFTHKDKENVYVMWIDAVVSLTSNSMGFNSNNGFTIKIGDKLVYTDDKYELNNKVDIADMNNIYDVENFDLNNDSHFKARVLRQFEFAKKLNSRMNKNKPCGYASWDEAKADSKKLNHINRNFY